MCDLIYVGEDDHLYVTFEEHMKIRKEAQILREKTNEQSVALTAARTEIHGLKGTKTCDSDEPHRAHTWLEPLDRQCYGRSKKPEWASA